MKKPVKSFICGCIAMAGSFATLQAQEASFAGNVTLKDDPFTSSFATLNTNAAKPIATVNAKVMKAFNQQYKDAANVTWYAVNKKYVALFDWGGLKAHALLGKNGYTFYDIRFGTESILPAGVRRIIKANYIDYTIGKVAEVNVEGQNAWVINLQGDNKIVIARVMDGAIEELAQYETQQQQPTTHKRARIIIPK